MAQQLNQTLAALKVWPGAARWRSDVALAVPTLLVMAGIGYLSGWISFTPVSDGRTILMAVAVLFFVPAVIEEIFFRGLLLGWLTKLTSRWSGWLSTLLYALWHPLQAVTFGPPWVSVFLQPSFIIATFLFGIILTHIRIVSGSLWPVIMIHWVAVLLWKLIWGGPFCQIGG